MKGTCLVEGDAVEAMSAMEDGSFDAVLTDPPYGIGFPYLGYEDTRENLVRLLARAMPQMRRVARRVYVLPGITQVSLYPEPDWIACVTWDTTGAHGKYGFTQWMPVLCYGPDVEGFARLPSGMLKSDVLRISGGAGVGFMRSAAEKGHTCPKPLNLMRLLVRRLCRQGEKILDPFAGSGTTLVAAAMEYCQATGIEREPEYCKLIRRRLASQEPLLEWGDGQG